MTQDHPSIFLEPLKTIANHAVQIPKLKKWTGLSKELFTDADNFRVRFIDAKLTADEKLLLLAGAVFTDLLYFETKASS
ncbi:MAG: phospholipid scramblase-related protein [Pseudanabaena sp.]